MPLGISPVESRANHVVVGALALLFYGLGRVASRSSRGCRPEYGSAGRWHRRVDAIPQGRASAPIIISGAAIIGSKMRRHWGNSWPSIRVSRAVARAAASAPAGMPEAPKPVS